jgi:tripartite-type tricarboxylate transporter receptor subunit TctC
LLRTAWLPPAAILALALAAPFAQAQGADPNKPIRVVMTFPPRGSADGVVRMLLPRLNEKLGQQMVVDNRPGAGGNIGLALVAKLIAFAGTSARRLPQLPDVPTASEAGLAGYDSTGWFGVVAPAGTPASVVHRLNGEITAALRDEAVQGSMRAQGVEPAPTTSEAFESIIRSETAKWAKVIKTANIKIE